MHAVARDVLISHRTEISKTTCDVANTDRLTNGCEDVFVLSNTFLKTKPLYRKCAKVKITACISKKRL